MRKILSSLFLIITLGSCYHTAPDPAFNMTLVIKQDSMVTLLTDLHLADGIIATLKDRKKPTEHLSNEYFDAVLQKHAIDSARFEESMRYYAFHTEELDDIYDRVIVNLSKEESMAIPKKETEKPVP
jgi:hypothetical protein